MDLTGGKWRKDGEECTMGSSIIWEPTLPHIRQTHKLMQGAMGTACKMNSGHSKTSLKEIVLETVILNHSTQLLTIINQVNLLPIFKHFIANTSHTVDLPSPSRPFKLMLSKGLRIPCLPHLIPWHCSVLRRCVCVLSPTNHLNNLTNLFAAGYTVVRKRRKVWQFEPPNWTIGSRPWREGDNEERINSVVRGIVVRGAAQQWAAAPQWRRSTVVGSSATMEAQHSSGQ